ncbi:cell division control protein Cdc6 [Halorubrum sp. 48-1-W]|uniref:ORC1-type DNA replication protein n=2 Tax=Halobacteriales TaxID=2235 RepID=A0A345EIC2_9EURY|nr:AAA family ATPase [Haloplanus rubicundus]RAW46726.1 cell division control protein Cdc6 [Halorubrum sp. 48-1-W]
MGSDVLNMTDNNTTQTTVDEILSVDDQSDEYKSKIFEKPWLLEIDNVPDANRIVGRDDKIKSLAKNLRKMRTDDVPDNIVMWGETGTGKTLVARHVCERLEATTEGTDGSIVTAYVNPDPISTYTSTFRKIAEQVNAKANDPVDVPSLGLSAEHYRDKKLWPIVEREFPGGLVVIIDEIDKHGEINEILYTLSRAKSKDDVNFPVVTIGISNDIEFKGDIDSRAQSTLQPKHWTFTPYEEDQLVSILDNRRDAFYQKVLEDDVISKVAELAADEHGDARRAVRLLRNAGEVADEEGGEIVTADHVSEADELVEVELFMEMVKGTPLSGKLLLFALTRLDRNNPEKEWFRTSEIHQVYETVAKDVRVEPKGYNRALELLNKHVTTGVLESKKKEGGDDGKFRSYSLQGEVESTRRGLINSTPELQELMG